MDIILVLGEGRGIGSNMGARCAIEAAQVLEIYRRRQARTTKCAFPCWGPLPAICTISGVSSVLSTGWGSELAMRHYGDSVGQRGEAVVGAGRPHLELRLSPEIPRGER